MKITDMNWMQVEEYLKHDDRAVVPLGSTEQHAYLSLSVDPMRRLIMETLRAEKYQASIVEALGRAEYHALEQRKTIHITARQLKPGMFLLEDALSDVGVMMAKGGQEVTPTVAVLLRRMADRNNLKEPLIVSVLAGYEPDPN